VQDELVAALLELFGDIELLTRPRVRLRKDLGQRLAELATRAGYEDASRSDRIGDDVLQSPRTRGSSQGMPCSSGSAGSYSSVTW
jgi:hypothetical protein